MKEQEQYPLKRPLTVTLIGSLYIAAGIIGFVYHLIAPSLSQFQQFLTLFLWVLAITGGIFVLFRAKWARWILLVWITYHLIISFQHSTFEIIMHVIFFILTIYCLLQPNASKYFRNKKKEAD